MLKSWLQSLAHSPAFSKDPYFPARDAQELMVWHLALGV